MAKRTVFLHIGEPKCASTHLQYVFELLQKELLQGGVAYHTVHKELGVISSGNLGPGRRTSLALQKRLHEAARAFPTQNLLFSSEWLFQFLLENDLHALSKMYDSQGYRLHILWVIRETEPLISSQLIQSLKDRPHSAQPELSSTISNFRNRLTARIQIIEQLHSLNIPYSLFNVSNTKTIEVDVVKSMGIDINEVPRSKKHNRSLTMREYSLISALQFLPDGKRLGLANALSIAHPHLKPWRMEFNAEETKQIAEELNPLIDDFNRRLKNPPVLNRISAHSSQTMQRSEASLKNTQELHFNEEEIEVIERWFNQHFIHKTEYRTLVWNAVKRKVIWVLTLQRWRS